MFRSWRIGEAFGIDVRIHWLFFALPLWIVVTSARAGESWEFATLKLVWLVAIFACVLLHEFGHALAARRYGIRTLDIIILPIGGLARLQRMTPVARQQMVIALAGPAVNLVIAMLLFVPWALSTNCRVPHELSLLGNDFLFFLMAANVLLVLCNLIPAYPMDGGRVLRSFMAMFTSAEIATIRAAMVGQVIAGFFAILSIYYGLWSLLLISVFVFLAAVHDMRIARRRLAYAQAYPDAFAEMEQRELRSFGTTGKAPPQLVLEARPITFGPATTKTYETRAGRESGS